MTQPYLAATDLSIETPSKRLLIAELQMRLEGEHVAVVGRNGVGKSLLLEVLAGCAEAARGRVECRGARHLVPQRLPGGTAEGAGQSAGETRRALLRAAFARRPDFLLLDEPSQDLDEEGIGWLLQAVEFEAAGLVVVSHDRCLLRCFEHFFIVEERGCRLFSGSFEELQLDFARRAQEANDKYAAELQRLLEKEQHNASIRRRRARKKAGGRVRELKRCPARARLNQKRDYAQVYQGKREGVRQQRIQAARDWARETRRTLSVELSLDFALPPLPEPGERPVVELRGVSVDAGGRRLIADLTLRLTRERLAVVGPNGSGKTSLLKVMTGELPPATGKVRRFDERIGSIAQHADNWLSEESLLSLLLSTSAHGSPAEVIRRLAAHRFPLALAERPLCSLSPGERARAALMCLFERRPAIELLILDEPTAELDLVGLEALERVLAAWPGGLVVVSHDPEFLESIGVSQRLELGNAARVTSRRSVERELR
jgi:ATPase subunit of ABC transporter with duplicated ATPase domains